MDKKNGSKWAKYQIIICKMTGGMYICKLCKKPIDYGQLYYHGPSKVHVTCATPSISEKEINRIRERQRDKILAREARRRKRLGISE